MSKARMILIGLGLMLVAVVVGAIPRSEGYSSFGLGIVGRVDVECGSVFSREQQVDFADYDEERLYYEEKRLYGEQRIFEGKTETQVCDEVLQTTKTVSLLAGIAGAIMFVIGLLRPSSVTDPVTPQPKPPATGSPPNDGVSAAPDRVVSTPVQGATATPIELDDPTKHVLGWVQMARSKVEPYIAPRLFLGAALAYLIAVLQDEWTFSFWGSIGYLKGIILITGIAGAVGFRGTGRYSDMVAAVGSAYLLGDGIWRLAGGANIGPVWVRIMLFAADFAILYGLIQYLAERGREPDRRGALENHAQIVLIGTGVVTLFLILVGRQRSYNDWITDVTYVTGFWVLFMVVIAAALLLRSKDLLMFAAVASAMRLMQLFMGWHDYTSGASPTLAKIGLVAVAGFAGWQWYELHQNTVPDHAGSASGEVTPLLSAAPPPMADPPSIPASPVPVVPVVPAPPTTDSVVADAVATPTSAGVVTGVAVFDAGEHVEFDRLLVVGRDPAPPDGVDRAVAYELHDPTFTVSKTHVLVGIEGDELWVEDLHSANGTELVLGDEVVALRPGMRRFVGDSQVIRAGEVRITLTTRTET